MPLKFIQALPIVFLLASCSEKPKTDQNSTNDDSGLDLSNLVASQSGGARDLASFLDSGEEAVAIDVVDGANFTENSSEVPAPEPQVDQHPQAVQENKPMFPSIQSVTKGADDFQENFEISLGELKTLNTRKDQTIASLTRLNEELILEIQRLRTNPQTSPTRITEKFLSNSDSQLQNLQNEIALLKASLIEKSQEINGLKLQNDRFQNGIDSLQPRVNTMQLSGASVPLREELSPPPRQKAYESSESLNSSESCSLEFDAVVTLLNGKNKEVFYTEFFLTSRSFPDLLFDEVLFLKDFPQVDSFEELWAQSRKSPFVFPGIFKRIRNALLRQVEQGKGYRVRTDIDGFAQFRNLTPGSFYLIGTAAVGKIGAVWNVPVRLRSGTNKTSLTLTNATWRE